MADKNVGYSESKYRSSKVWTPSVKDPVCTSAVRMSRDFTILPWKS